VVRSCRVPRRGRSVCEGERGRGTDPHVDLLSPSRGPGARRGETPSLALAWVLPLPSSASVSLAAICRAPDSGASRSVHRNPSVEFGRTVARREARPLFGHIVSVAPAVPRLAPFDVSRGAHLAPGAGGRGPLAAPAARTSGRSGGGRSLAGLVRGRALALPPGHSYEPLPLPPALGTHAPPRGGARRASRLPMADPLAGGLDCRGDRGECGRRRLHMVGGDASRPSGRGCSTDLSRAVGGPSGALRHAGLGVRASRRGPSPRSRVPRGYVVRELLTVGAPGSALPSSLDRAAPPRGASRPWPILRIPIRAVPFVRRISGGHHPPGSE